MNLLLYTFSLYLFFFFAAAVRLFVDTHQTSNNKYQMPIMDGSFVRCSYTIYIIISAVKRISKKWILLIFRWGNRKPKRAWKWQNMYLFFLFCFLFKNWWPCLYRGIHYESYRQYTVEFVCELLFVLDANRKT